MRKIKQLKIKLLITAAILAYVAVLCILKLPCIIFHFTGIRCLGCGMSRAFLAVLKLDFKTAFTYHGMFWSLPILYFYFLFDGELFKNKAINILVIVIIAIGFALNWLFSTIS